MTRTWGIILAACVAGALIVSALIVRSGLIAIATAVQDKPFPKWPEQLHIVAGDSKVKLDIANLTVQQGTSSADAKISIDNIHVLMSATQQSR